MAVVTGSLRQQEEAREGSAAGLAQARSGVIRTGLFTPAAIGI
jgi:hypothetical protein